MIVEFAVKKYLPVNFFDDEMTREFFTYINKGAKVPQKNALRSMISSTFKSIQTDVIAKLQSNLSKLSFTLDGWTSISATCFYGITGKNMLNLK